MTPVQKELFKQSGRARWTRAAKSVISWAAIFAIVSAWTITMQLIDFAKHLDRMDLYERCLSQQLELADKLPRMVMVPGCSP